MRRHYFLGLAAGYKHSAWRPVFTRGMKRDVAELEKFLGKKYGGDAMATKNGRSALALALKSLLKRGDKVLVNGFTCHAVVEAVKATGMTPVFVDISRETLNFTPETLEAAFEDGATGIIVQNTLGRPVNMDAVERFAKKHKLVIIEDLAHSAGVKYPDGREAGTVGAATVLSFGKEKMIDATSGGAVVVRRGATSESRESRSAAARELAPAARGDGPDGRDPRSLVAPRLADSLRARFYPLLAAICRGLSYVHLSGVLMRFFIKVHWVEKSADNKLDLTRGIAPFEAKLALEQLECLKHGGEKPLREFYLVENRAEVLEKLKQAGFYFDGFWYEKPVSPVRYYQKVHFPEDKCPVAVEVAAKIINFPTHYRKKDLEEAYEIVKKEAK